MFLITCGKSFKTFPSLYLNECNNIGAYYQVSLTFTGNGILGPHILQLMMIKLTRSRRFFFFFVINRTTSDLRTVENLQHCSCKGSPLAMCDVNKVTSATSATIPNNAETIHFCWECTMLGCTEDHDTGIVIIDHDTW